MATTKNSDAPAPTPARERTPNSRADKRREERAWTPPDQDQEFIFDRIDNAPEWVDRGWAGFDRGPALAVPVGDLYAERPYTTQSARPGDKVLFIAPVGSTPAHLEVVRREPDPEKGDATKRLPQQSQAQEEDLIKLGWLTPDDLGEDAKAQVIARSPKLRRLIEGDAAQPKQQSVADIVKLD